MERNRRKPKNDKWMMYGFYAIKKTFKSKSVQLKERGYIENYKDDKNDWIRIYLYYKNKKEEIPWVMAERIEPLQVYMGDYGMDEN